MEGAGGGGVGEGNADSRDRWRQAARNSSPIGRSSSRVSEVLSFQARVPGSRARGGSSSSSSEGKKLDNDWFFGVLGGDSGCKVSCKLELLKVAMMAVCEGTSPVG